MSTSKILIECPTWSSNHNGFLEIKSRFDMKLHSCKQVWKTTPAIRLLQLDEQTPFILMVKPWCWFDNRIFLGDERKMHFNTSKMFKIKYLFGFDLQLGNLNWSATLTNDQKYSWQFVQSLFAHLIFWIRDTKCCEHQV